MPGFNRALISLAAIGVSAVPVAIGWQNNFSDWGLVAAQSSLEQAIENEKATKLQAKKENKETAMRRALDGCIPVVDAKTSRPLNYLTNGVPIRRIDGQGEPLDEGDAVCSRKGDVAIIRDGVTAEKANVGFDKLEAYTNIYRSYLD